jgi:hypothetical protein
MMALYASFYPCGKKCRRRAWLSGAPLAKSRAPTIINAASTYYRTGAISFTGVVDEYKRSRSEILFDRPDEEAKQTP